MFFLDWIQRKFTIISRFCFVSKKDLDRRNRILRYSTLAASYCIFLEERPNYCSRCVQDSNEALRLAAETAKAQRAFEVSASARRATASRSTNFWTHCLQHLLNQLQQKCHQLSLQRCSERRDRFQIPIHQIRPVK